MQTSVSDTYPIGYEGAIADASPRHIASGIVEEATGIKPGRFVVKGTNDRQVLLPSAVAQITNGSVQGIAVFEPGREPGGVDGQFLDEQTLPIMKKGMCWMIAEDAVAKGGQVFVRAVAAGAEEYGRVRSDADTADAAACPNARFESTTTGANQLVLVSINLPY